MRDYIYCDITEALNHTNAIRRKQVKQLDTRIRWCAFGTLLCVIGLSGMIFEQNKEIKRLKRIVDYNEETVYELNKRVQKLENKDLEE
ncbi:MAG: hypothetical protein J6U54_11360 [Clostridiales bacterium]|nr:hypothetical protein [Clostridiales bacterium]